MHAFLTLLTILPVALSLPIVERSFLSDLFSDATDDDSTPQAKPTPLSLDQVNSTLFRPGQFARAAYCSSASLQAWDCGTPCSSIGNVKFLQTGGDRGTIPLYYIAHDQQQNTLVVAHQGTDPKKIASILNDAQFGLVALNTSRFPEAEGQNITVHDGFQQTFERTADGLLAGVNAGLSSTGATSVLVTGHSLGAALATMTGAFLHSQLAQSNPDVKVSVVGFGMPRSGDQAWADFIDNGVGTTFVTNQHDPVPSVPPLFLSFHHSAGEVHIPDSTGNNFLSCPGQDNEGCATGNSLLSAKVADHIGPYFSGLSFSAKECTENQ